MTGLRNIIDYDVESKLSIGNQNLSDFRLQSRSRRYQESEDKRHINKWSFGIANSKYKLTTLPQPDPKPFPKENSPWPTRAALSNLNKTPHPPPQLYSRRLSPLLLRSYQSKTLPYTPRPRRISALSKHILLRQRPSKPTSTASNTISSKWLNLTG